LFREFSSEENSLELLRLGDTRFGANFIMLERLQKVKNINSTNGYEFKSKKLGFVHMKKMMLNVHLLRVVKEMLAHTWWSSSGSEAPKLQKPLL
jgi:hypothetical protein